MKKNSKNSGFSTLELLIAMTILIMVLSAVIFVTFGNQSISIDNETSSEALNKAKGLLEKEQALARKDFKLVNPIAETTDDIYKKSVSVENVDFFTKRVKSLITWTGDHNRPLHTELTTLITNFENAVGGDTCYSNLSGDWEDPEIVSTIDFAALAGVPAGTYTLTDVDAYKEKLYVTASATTNLTDPTFFVFDVSDPTDPDLIGKIDNAGSVALGLNAVRASQNSVTGKVFAYAASNTASNYSSCNPVDPLTFIVDPACGQLVVFDVSNSTPIKKANLKITSSPAITGQNVGTSIFYKNGYVLLGLRQNSGGPEFHIVDMHNPDSVTSGAYPSLGNLEMGHDVNALTMQGTFAYAAIPQDATAKELQVLKVNDPLVPTAVGGFDMSGGGNGKSIYTVGDRLYFGNTVPSGGNDFHVLNNITPTTTLPEIAGQNISTSLNAIIVRSNLAFLLTNDDLEILDIGDPEKLTPFTITSVATLELPVHSTSPIPEPSMDCEGNNLYISSNDSSGQGQIYIISSNP